jgi:hypothetical protein
MRWFRYTVPAIALSAAAVTAFTHERAPAPPVITVTAKEFEFDAPASVPAGVVTFKLVNAGKQLHHASLVKLEEGKTGKDLLAALSKPGPPPAWAVAMGGPNAPDPGQSANATVALRPGKYAWVCFIPDTDKAPHFVKGMVKEFDVAPPAGSMTLPAAAISVQLSDYEFKLSSTPKAGKQTWRIRNYASQPHELELVKIAPGKTIDDLKAWLKTEAGPPPGNAVGGIAILGSNTANNADFDLTPGTYALLCFVPDAKDGQPHFAHGMILAFTVK